MGGGYVVGVNMSVVTWLSGEEGESSGTGVIVICKLYILLTTEPYL